MQWVVVVIASVIWFATCSYYEEKIAVLEKEHAVALQTQAQTNEKYFLEEFQQEKEKYEKLLQEYKQARLDVADVRSSNDRMRQQLSTLSRVQTNKDRETCIRELNECREVAVELSDLAGQAYEAFELQKRADKITGKIVK
ncbi:hypothetical protein [Parasutterella muris]|uniref:hypothetical protein n=1 Tax=Parasutterella muris TaxID=2565572 RepID=UPI00203C1299|nr:hypothetical protein [Parasutterella muris]